MHLDKKIDKKIDEKADEKADEKERELALDPTHSFIVQAPAGSGKTELLTQRFLVLLTQAKIPEEIIAITFTKKSAAEMRARIIKALNNAHHSAEPLEPHAKKTWRMAKLVLKRDKNLNWHLLENPNRLRIQTIDSFNAYLTKQLPMLSQFGAAPSITDDAMSLYRQAVTALLSHLENTSTITESISVLLSYLDNDLNTLQSLLIKMLSARDQWLPHLMLGSSATDDNFLRKQLETTLESITSEILSTLCNYFPNELYTETLLLADYAAYHLTDKQNNISHCKQLTRFPSNNITDKNIWLGFAELFLTKEYEFRKKIDKTIGFRAPSSAKNSDEKNRLSDLKKRMEALIKALSEHSQLKIAFEKLQKAPLIFYRETEWQMLKALFNILKMAVAELRITFQEHGKIDYIENALAALQALGTDDDPTDTTLALDHQIHHILIDEFQDTSKTQYNLIKKLTIGWEQNDNRTLFLVGDPMQSIYRFREAEVGLFIRTLQNGLGNIKLQALKLSVNFRSDTGIVNWVNQHFVHVFPKFNDMTVGAVTFSPSTAKKIGDTLDPVTLNAFLKEETISQEALAIVELIRHLKKASPTDTIAILVRSRTHLTHIIPALKNANLFFSAIDIDPLSTRPVISDLLALMQALLNPADRIAWLAILRAPWLGLTLNDLLIIAGDHSHSILWERLQSKDILKNLSIAGQQRLVHFMKILTHKMAERGRLSMRLWLESTWLLLGGPASLINESDLEDAAAFFNLIEKLTQNSVLPNITSFTDAINKLYASPDKKADQTLQIMTIHNAKGLEFDTVILPQLNRQSPNDDKQLLLWLERAHYDSNHPLVLGPLHVRGQKNNSIYTYIKNELQIKTDYEIARLLYVAATRAKKQLHLFFSMRENKKLKDLKELIDRSPSHHSLLSPLWHAIKHEVKWHPLIEKTPDTQPELVKNTISRLTAAWENPIKEMVAFDKIAYHHAQLGFHLPQNNAKLIGTMVHRLLQQISLFGSHWWQEKSSAKELFLYQFFAAESFSDIEIAEAITRVSASIDNALADPRGQWILKNHQQAQSEFKISGLINNKIASYIIDRTFVDEKNIRWIIDYKTSVPTTQDLAIFLQESEEKHRKQLTQYAAMMQAYEKREIRLGLYFPLVPAWREYRDKASA